MFGLKFQSCDVSMTQYLPIGNETDSSCNSENVSHHVLIVRIHGTNKDDETLLTLQHPGQAILPRAREGRRGGGREIDTHKPTWARGRKRGGMNHQYSLSFSMHLKLCIPPPVLLWVSLLIFFHAEDGEFGNGGGNISSTMIRYNLATREDPQAPNRRGT